MFVIVDSTNRLLMNFTRKKRPIMTLNVSEALRFQTRVAAERYWLQQGGFLPAIRIEKL